MREILFRGQTRRKGEIVRMDGKPVDSNWVYGGIFPNNDDGDFAIIYQQEPEIEKFPVYANTVGQYTGLVDKNGKKIFEGDIVDYEDEAPGQYEYHDSLIINRGVIEYSEGCFYWTNAVNANLLDYVYKGVADCEVIGNIFDNRDLLEVES